MGSLTPQQVISALGFRVVVEPNLRARICESTPDAHDAVVGAPGNCNAALWRRGVEFIVVVPGLTHGALADALHEAIHGFMGESSFIDETALMAVEWQVCQELEPVAYAVWREKFSDYGLGDNTEAGPTDDFMSHPAWQECVDDAIKQDFLTADGRMVWGKGPHHTLGGYHDGYHARRQRRYG